MSRHNLREARGKIRRLLGPGTDDTLTAGEIDDAFNEAYRRLCKEFGILTSSWTAAAVSEARFYKPPEALIELGRVDFDDNIMGYALPDDIWKLGDDDIDLQAPTWTEDV